MYIDGKKIRDEIELELKAKVAGMATAPTLALFYVGENPVIEVFVNLKKKFGEAIGVEVTVARLPESTSEVELIQAITAVSADGIVVQLPLPPHIDTTRVLSSVPIEKDIDVLSPLSLAALGEGRGAYLPPVVGAIAEILVREKVSLENKNIVIIGKGKLVGLPCALWLDAQHIPYTILTRESTDFALKIQNADIIVSGAGSPGIVNLDMIKTGVILFDAGTSEEGGRIQGDIDPACAEVASIFTPVPGGIGPITIAILFKNLLTAMKK